MENNNDIQLIKIEAVVREEMFVDVKKALTDIGVNGITAYQVVGCGLHICYLTEYIHKLRQICKFIESALKTETASLYSKLQCCCHFTKVCCP